LCERHVRSLSSERSQTVSARVKCHGRLVMRHRRSADASRRWLVTALTDFGDTRGVPIQKRERCSCGRLRERSDDLWTSPQETKNTGR
jgi:hypothetical protein